MEGRNKNEILLNLPDGVRLFNNFNGAVKSGTRFYKAGLIRGASDLIGWAPIEITQAMVGKKIAAFMAIEVKASECRKATKEQLVFIQNVKLSGGIAGVATSSKCVESIVQAYVKSREQ